MTSNGTLRRIVAVLGFAVGAAVGGFVFWTIGYYGWVSPIEHPIQDLLVFVTLLVFPMSLIAPLAVVRYLGRNVEGAMRWGVTLTAYALLVGFTFALAYFELFQALDVDSGEKALAFFAAVFGASFGGIVGSKLAARIAEPGVRTEDGSESGWGDDGRDGWENGG